jgi:hypothetical protein
MTQVQATILSATIAALIVAGGWFMTNWLATKREHANRRREIRLAYLFDAYDKLSASANRQLTPEFARSMEVAISKIQLMGTLDEIRLSHVFLDEWSRKQSDGRPRANLDPLLFELRNNLRREIELPPVNTPVRWIRPEGGLQ